MTDPKDVGRLLRTIWGYHGTFVVACALKIAPYVFVRPGELQQARWADIDFESCEWRYTALKTDTPHIVPLAPQVVEILKELHPYNRRVMREPRCGGKRKTAEGHLLGGQMENLRLRVACTAFWRERPRGPGKTGKHGEGRTEEGAAAVPQPHHQ